MEQSSIETAPVKNLMAKNVACVYPETPLIQCINLMLKKKFSGLPVVNQKQRLIGIINDYDLTIRKSYLHLPTFFKLFQEFDIYRKDKRFLDSDIKKIIAMRVKDVMNSNPLSIHYKNKIEKVIRLFNEFHGVNAIPVVDDSNRVVGIITRHDIIRFTASPSVSYTSNDTEREIDKNINKFLKDFDNKFIFISRARTKFWLIISLFFALIGFIIAFAIILRIKVN